jgi:hypothetical protein
MASKIQAIAAEAADAGSFQKQVEAFVSKARMLADGGLTPSEAAQLLLAFIELLVGAAEDLQDASGEDKKVAVESAVHYLLDIIAPAVPLPWYLLLFKRPLRAAAEQLIDGAIEAAVARLPDRPKTAPGAVAVK